MKFSIKLLYLYLFSFIGLLVSVIGIIQLADLGMQVIVFGNADRYEYVKPIQVDGEKINIEEDKRLQDLEFLRQRQRRISTAVSMILVGFPLYLYHWRKLKD